MAELERLESTIKSALKKIKLGDALNALYVAKSNSTEITPFMVAGFALFAARFCSPSKVSQKIKPYDIRKFRDLIHLSNNYVLSDPITFDKNLKEEFITQNPVFLLLRIASSQFPFQPSLFSSFAQPFYLYNEIPQQLSGLPDIPNFDFDSKFQDITGVSVLDFITIGFIIFATSASHFSFTRSYFQKFRKKGISIPDAKTIRLILNQLSADKDQLINLYEKRKNRDRRFKAYDFNPFLQYPLIKPCQNKQFAKAEEDFYHAPVPELIASRVSSGIFYQMFNEYKTTFSEYFGFVFVKYVGLVLENCVNSEKILSESDIRSFYSKDKGKVPDWIIIDGSTAILLECKATRFSRAAQAIASEDAVNSSLSQVTKGFKQLAQFISACKNKVAELGKFHHCNKFIPVIISLEPMYLINSVPFRDHIDSLLADEHISKFDWQILAINELEAIQPHLNAELKLSQVLENLRQTTFNNVLDDLVSQTNKSFEDSFLYQKQEEIYQRLGIPGRVNHG